MDMNTAHGETVRQQRYPLGCQVCKLFSNKGYQSGKIMKFDHKNYTYLIRYDNGDEEEIGDKEELERIVNCAAEQNVMEFRAMKPSNCHSNLEAMSAGLSIRKHPTEIENETTMASEEEADTCAKPYSCQSNSEVGSVGPIMDRRRAVIDEDTRRKCSAEPTVAASRKEVQDNVNEKVQSLDSKDGSKDDSDGDWLPSNSNGSSISSKKKTVGKTSKQKKFNFYKNEQSLEPNDLSDVPDQEPILKGAKEYNSFNDNTRNRPARSGSSKYIGVYYDKYVKGWKAQISIDKKVRSLGYYPTEIMAAKVYAKAAFKYKKKKPDGVYGGVDLSGIPDQPLILALGKNKGEGKVAYKGVKTVKKKGKVDKYQPRIGVRGKMIYMGTFDTPEEAAAIFAKAHYKFFGKQ